MLHHGTHGANHLRLGTGFWAGPGGYSCGESVARARAVRAKARGVGPRAEARATFRPARDRARPLEEMVYAVQHRDGTETVGSREAAMRAPARPSGD
jgi:hypothetical protein